MILTEQQLRLLIREAIVESSDSKIGRSLGAEYIYALMQPAMIDTAQLDFKKISLPPHQRQEVEIDEPEPVQLKDKGSEIDEPDSGTVTYMADIEKPDLDDELRITKR